jgi:hypothetical protein
VNRRSVAADNGAMQPQQEQTWSPVPPRPRAPRVVVVLLSLILTLLVVDAIVTVALLLAIRSDLADWGQLLDGFFGYR